MKTIHPTKAISALTLGTLLIGSAAMLGGFTSAETATGETLEAQAAETYGVDPVHTSVLFQIRHAGVANFYGRFNEVKGTIENFDGSFEGSKLSFEIPIDSVDTNSNTRDGHLKDAEFFNARQFPKAEFVSTGVKDNGDGTYELKGRFTLHGETKVIRATVTDVRTGTFRDNPVLGFQADFTIKRSDYGIMKYLASDLSDDGPLGNTVRITVAVEAVQG